MSPRAPVDALTGLEAARFGVYVHFPYCLSKCPYCDFASTAAREVPDGRYTDAILRELEARAALVGRREVQSIFFGGGTPSLWAPGSVARVLEALARAFSLAPGCEITLEANPGAADAERFAAYRSAGVNRLSMGVQSFDAATLQRLGRAHDGPTAVRAFERARAAGFDNVSMDFIYGVHGQTADEVERDARRAVELGSEHLSAYALTLDRPSLAEDVPLAKQLARGEVHLPADDVVIDMQRRVRDVFAGAGLERYEISNYARPGLHSRHNALYWTGGEYLALGTGATGFVRAPEPMRTSNHRSADRYLSEVEAGRLPDATREPLGAVELFEERVAMGLRLVNGVDLSQACELFGQDASARETAVRQLIATGLATLEAGRLRLTDRGFDLHSSIAARLM
ncbi:MAG: radical SAM family heme chaperone HemW [Myxococcaceae bacterium]